MTVAKTDPSHNRPVASLPSSNPNPNSGFLRVAQSNAAAELPVVRSRSPSPTEKAKVYPREGSIAAPPADGESRLLSLVLDKRMHFNDAHMHPTDYRQNGLDLSDTIQHMDKLRIGYTTLMPLPTSLNNAGAQTELVETMGLCGCEPRYYLPEDLRCKKTLQKEDIERVKKMAEMFLDTDVDFKTAINYKKLGPQQQIRFDPMITGLHIGNADCSNRLLEKLHLNPGVFTGVGEITVHKEVVDEILSQKWANLTDNVNPLLQLLRTCGKIGMPVVLHCDIGRYSDAPDDVPAHLNNLRNLFSHEYARGTTIIWAHAGGIGRFVGVPDGHVEILRTLLGDRENYSNLHIDLSWDVVAEKLFKIDGQLEAWAALINAYPARFIFGSDCLVPNTPEKWNSTYTKYEMLIAQLDEQTVAAVFTDNYERIFLGARSKVREYEKTKLAEDFKKLNPYYNPPVSAVATRPAYADPAMTAASSSTSTTSTSRAQELELELQDF